MCVGKEDPLFYLKIPPAKRRSAPGRIPDDAPHSCPRKPCSSRFSSSGAYARGVSYRDPSRRVSLAKSSYIPVAAKSEYRFLWTHCSDSARTSDPLPSISPSAPKEGGQRMVHVPTCTPMPLPRHRRVSLMSSPSGHRSIERKQNRERDDVFGGSFEVPDQRVPGRLGVGYGLRENDPVHLYDEA
jgi:hypothetical protein